MNKKILFIFLFAGVFTFGKNDLIKVSLADRELNKKILKYTTIERIETNKIAKEMKMLYFLKKKSVYEWNKFFTSLIYF